MHVHHISLSHPAWLVREVEVEPRLIRDIWCDGMQDLVAPEHHTTRRHTDLDYIFRTEPLLPGRALLNRPEVTAWYDERHSMASDGMIR